MASCNLTPNSDKRDLRTRESEIERTGNSPRVPVVSALIASSSFIRAYREFSNRSLASDIFPLYYTDSPSLSRALQLPHP